MSHSNLEISIKYIENPNGMGQSACYWLGMTLFSFEMNGPYYSYTIFKGKCKLTLVIGQM